MIQINKANIWACAIGFFIPGAYLSTWAGFIPTFKANLNLNEDILGYLILLLGIGALIAMPFVAQLTEKFSCRRIIVFANTLAILDLMAITQVDRIWQGAVLILIFGFAMGMCDVSANVQALLIESLSGKKFMSSFHGGWSIGSFIGAGVLTVLLKFFNLPIVEGIRSSLLIWLILLCLIMPKMLPIGSLEDKTNKNKSKVPLTSNYWVLLIGVLTFFAFVVEGAMTDWSALYLISIKGYDASLATLGFMFFNLTMTIGRFIGDFLRSHFSVSYIIITSYIVGIFGVVGILTLDDTIVLGAFALLGIGLSNVVPTLFSSLGIQKVVPVAQALSTVTTIGYIGVIAGPGLIGLIANRTSLYISFIGLALLLVISMGVYYLVYKGKVVSEE